jgi:PD-(D/E)XK endonuclease
MRERLINRRQQGDLGEVSAIEWLTRQGATVSVPMGHSPNYDLLADIHGRILRVQVKTATHRLATPNGHERWYVYLCTNGGNQSWTGTVKRFDPSAVDALFALVGDGRRWFIPAWVVEGGESVQLGGPKYSEHEIEPAEAILPLVYGEESDGSRIDRASRGSVEAGESSCSVKAVPMAEWVRIPPPPSPAQTDETPPRPPKFSRTRISSGHQITIPSVPFRDAQLVVGDRLKLTADGPGRVILERIEAGSNTLPLDGLDN